jgi:glycosyltransferase A (GT-A) superfamily protein (DUF2064 family)
MLKTGVVVFARVPGSGGKTRLAATWDRERTDSFYDHCLDCAALWLLARSKYVKPCWALTDAGCREVTVWRDIQILDQLDGGFGEHMADICRQLIQQHSFWCLVGTDSPHMPPLSDLEISSRLQQSDFVFGPSSDGGFWLIAGRRPLSSMVFGQVLYSQSDTSRMLTRKVILAHCEKDYRPESLFSIQLNKNCCVGY